MQRTAQSFFIIIFLFLLLSACAYNPFRTDNRMTGNAGGAVIGGVAVAAPLAILNAPKPLIALGALGGASVGYYMTTLRAASAEVLQAGGVVYSLGDYVTVEIPSDQLFDVNTAELLPEAEPILRSAVSVLNHFPQDNIMVSGNTSGFGPEHYEQQLSQKRAREVAGFLWANGINNFQSETISMRKLSYVGYGNYFPIANNIKATGIRQNSRIQITGYPSRDQLHIDERAKMFNNIGDLNEPYLKRTRLDLNKVFPNEGLPEGEYPPHFRGAINESPMYSARKSYPPYMRSYKGEDWQNQNAIFGMRNEPPRPPSRADVYTNYKGAVRYKGE